MKHLFLAAAITLVASTAAQAQNCVLKLYGSLQMTTYADGTIGVPIRIGGTDRNLLLDISENASSVSPSLANELKLEPVSLGNGRRAGQMGWPMGEQVTLPEIKIGNVTGKNVETLLLPDISKDTLLAKLHPDLKLPDGVSGILGLNILGKFDLELDFQKAMLNLYDQDHCGGGAEVYWANSAVAVPFTQNANGTIQVAMQLDGTPVTVHLETTRGGFSMSEVALKRLFKIDNTSKDLKVISTFPNGKASAYRYPFKTLSVSGLSINNPEFDVEPTEFVTLSTGGHEIRRITFEPLGDVRFGLKELRKFHLFIAFKEKLVYFTSVDAHK